MAAAQSVADAYKLVVNAPPASSPGRKYYSNLDDFLMSYSPPFGATRDELALYLALIEKIDKAGELPAGARQKIEGNRSVARVAWCVLSRDRLTGRPGLCGLDLSAARNCSCLILAIGYGPSHERGDVCFNARLSAVRGTRKTHRRAELLCATPRAVEPELLQLLDTAFGQPLECS